MGRKIQVPVGTDVESYMKTMIIKFNAVEESRGEQNPKYIVMKRVFIGLKKVSGSKIVYCDLSGKKFNNVTIMMGGISYDLMRCPRCKKFYPRYGLGQNFNYDKNICKPETLCRPCNKNFSSVKALEKHNEKDKHRVPKYLVTQANLTEYG